VGYQASQQSLHETYAREREAALTAYLKTPEGGTAYDAIYVSFLELYRRVEPHRCEAAAAEATRGKIDRELVAFPDFGVWLLNQQTHGKSA
jgi:hypothetical protein